jgi:ankyrin repeat protein
VDNLIFIAIHIAENRLLTADALSSSTSTSEIDFESAQIRFNSKSFHDSISFDRLSKLKQSSDFQSDLNAQLNDGSTALHLAVWKDSLEMVKLLLGTGASLSIVTTNGFTPLHTAVFNEKPRITELLLGK